MNFKTILNIILSILVGLYFASYFTLLSGMNPSFEKLLTAAIFVICIWLIVSIYREQNQKLRLIQMIIFISAMVIGLYMAKTDSDSITGENLKTSYQTEIKLDN